MDKQKLIGTPVDMAPWGYTWRRDREIQERAEAAFIPHRLKRQETIYRTHKQVLGPEQTKAICYANQPDMLEDFLPAPEHPLLTGLLWVGGVNDYCVELIWPEGSALPEETAVDVRTYPTAWGWFGWTVDRRMERESVSKDGLIWSYPCPKGLMIDYCYNSRVKAQTEMIAVFAPEGCPIPQIRITGGSLGSWKEMSFTVEWGFTEATPAFTGDFETHVAYADAPVIEGNRAKFTCLYSDVSRYGLDSRITIVTDRRECIGATVLLRDLAKGPICVPEVGLIFCPDTVEMTVEEYLVQQKAQGKKTLREKIAEHPEAHDWEELVKKVRLWRCPDGTTIRDFPEAPAPAVVLHVPDKRWETMYDLAVQQLRGRHMGLPCG